jgi:hypothetical protein
MERPIALTVSGDALPRICFTFIQLRAVNTVRQSISMAFGIERDGWWPLGSVSEFSAVAPDEHFSLRREQQYQV